MYIESKNKSKNLQTEIETWPEVSKIKLGIHFFFAIF